MRRRHLLASGGLLPLVGLARHAHALDPPGHPVVLTITGKLAHRNQGDTAAFDMPMLLAMRQHSFTTKTPWFAKPRKFSGPLLRDVLSACGARGSQLRAVALNDYRVDIPTEDTQRFDVLLACLLDDKPMLVRDKGPLFIIYPFDARQELRNAIYYSRSAWQLKTIEVL